MKILNEIKFTVPADSRNEGLSRVVVSAFAAQLDPSVSAVGEIKTAVSEAVTNCIVHAYKGTSSDKSRIEITARALEDNTLYIKIRDSGCGIPDIKKAMEPMYTSAPEEERAGLGFAVMESFMDQVTVRSTPGKGTTVIMKRRILSEKSNT